MTQSNRSTRVIAKTHRSTAYHRHKAVLVGVAIALFAGPASWLMVSAQSAPVETDSLSSSEAASAKSTRFNNDRSHSSSKASQANTKSSTDASATNSSAVSNSKTSSSSAASSTSNKPNTSSSSTPAVAPRVASKPAPAPAPSPVAVSTASHDNITSTIFWVGEAADASNANITNTVSAWDESWQAHYGGVDDPNSRNGYYPAAFTPHENPFYFALPYNDFTDGGDRKTTAGSCPNAATVAGQPYSWCKNAWIKINHGGKTTYAQWQDVGPLQEDDTAYVFGSARPKNTWGAKAGLDVSPAVRDYLGLQDVDSISWSFISSGNIPAGPWKQIVTTSLGT